MEVIKRQIFVLRDTLKDIIDYNIGTDMVPIEYHVMDFTVPATAAAVVYVLKPDGELDKILADVMDNVISFKPTKGFFLEGLNAIQIRIVDNNKALVSFTETVRVGKSMKFDDATEAQQETLIQQVLTKTGEIEGKIQIEIKERKEAITEEARIRKETDEKKANSKDLKQHACRETVKTLTATEEGYALDATMGPELEKQIRGKCATTTMGGYRREWLITEDWTETGNYDGFEGEDEYYIGTRGNTGYIEIKKSGVYLIVFQASVHKKTNNSSGNIWSDVIVNGTSIGGDVHFMPQGVYYDTLSFVTYQYMAPGSKVKARMSVNEGLTDVWSQGAEYLNIIKLS